MAADGTLKKPFEASALVSAVKPLAEAAARDSAAGYGAHLGRGSSQKRPAAPFVAVVDSEQVRAAVTVALDASFETMIDEITRRVLAAMRSGNAEPRLAEARCRRTAPPIAAAQPVALRRPEPPKPPGEPRRAHASSRCAA